MEENIYEKQLYPWRIPQPFCSTLEIMEKTYPLMVYNSLTRTKVRFIPKDRKTISWYQCGPTVYADSHIGHARTYVSLDVIRRIMKDILGYNVLLCQNITDVDDKIIMASSKLGIPFNELSSKYETEFFEDMASLGVLLPDLSTRVSEYINEIIEYIKKLIQKGIAYESNGSVYFSVKAFESKHHTYGKLLFEQIGNSQLLAEGEGALCGSTEEKKAAEDFVLWKKTKDHTNDGIVEPFWLSPDWGNGRPGWHIECSVMAGYAMKRFGGGQLDIHAGGIDLKFPHHENEIAQSEAYHDTNQWVNYWLHTGHLNIHGLKMSKSLKNFITIRGALKVYSSRQIRFCFLLHKYNATMDYSDQTMNQAITIEKIFSEYFHNVKASLRRFGTNGSQHVGEREQELLQYFEGAKSDVRNSLLDDFDTPRAIHHLRELIRECNKYMEVPHQPMSSIIVASVARYVTSILRTFGLLSVSNSSGGNTLDIGFPLSSGVIALHDVDGQKIISDGQVDTANTEMILTPYLDVLTKFRERVRIAAIGGYTTQVLQAADELRDMVLPNLGVRMEDKGSGKDVVTVWKFDDPEQLKKEVLQKEEARQQKELQILKLAKKRAERNERAKVSPLEMFRLLDTSSLSKEGIVRPLYTAFDENGVPTHDLDGNPLEKSAIKKLLKEQSKQKEIHEKYLAKSSSSIN